jgi:hypothetical protein
METLNFDAADITPIRDSLRNLQERVNRMVGGNMDGGEGSGNYGHEGRPGEIGGSGGGESKSKTGRSRNSAPVVELTGNELGIRRGETIKEAALRYYEGLRKGDPAKREGFGEVEFTRVGRRKLKDGSLSEQEHLKLLPAIKPIIEKGDYLGRAELDKARNDGIVAFHYFEGNVKIGNETKFVGVSVAEDRRGNKFYNLNESPDVLLARKKARESAEASIRGLVPLGNTTDSADSILNIIVSQNPPDFKDMASNTTWREVSEAIKRLRKASGF